MTRKQRKDRQNELLDQFGLTKIRKTKANRVSGGERRRLEIARSLITEPKLIMLDEPFAGIDPKTVAEIQDQIRALVETLQHRHPPDRPPVPRDARSDRPLLLIREGRVFAYGNREQILNNADVRQHYIGERFDVGHLLEKRRPSAITQAAARIEERETPAPAELPDLSSRQISTDLIVPPYLGPDSVDDDPFATVE